MQKSNERAVREALSKSRLSQQTPDFPVAAGCLSALRLLLDTICETKNQILLTAMEKKRPDMQNWWLHMDNATPHTSKQTSAFLAKHGIRLLPHPPYSPDIAPCDFALFPHLKRRMRGTTFQSRESLIKKTISVLHELDTEWFEKTFDRWILRYSKCLDLGGDYVTSKNLKDD